MSDEWITIRREVLNPERYESDNVFRLFLYFINHASTRPKTVKGVRLERGQLLVTRKAVCEATKMTERNYRTAISILSDNQRTTNERPTTDQRVTIKTTNKFSIITICCFDDYVINNDNNRPSERPTTDQRTTNNRPANDQQPSNPPNQPKNPPNLPKEKESEKENLSPTPPIKEKVKEKEKAAPQYSLRNKSEKETNSLRSFGKEKEETPVSFSSGDSNEPPSDAIKKVEEALLTKQKKMKVRMEQFYNSLVPYLHMYSKEMIRGFFDYWSEPNKSQTMMRFEQERTWSLGMRLAYWYKRGKQYARKSISDEKREANDAVIERLREDALRRLRPLDEEEPMPI